MTKWLNASEKLFQRKSIWRKFLKLLIFFPRDDWVSKLNSRLSFFYQVLVAENYHLGLCLDIFSPLGFWGAWFYLVLYVLIFIPIYFKVMNYLKPVQYHNKHIQSTLEIRRDSGWHINFKLQTSSRFPCDFWTSLNNDI